jgi:hypothetical protein
VSSHTSYAMNAAASRTWALMTDGIAAGIGPGEEALTDLNLIELRRVLPTLNVKKFSRDEERGNGADWEWWIGSTSERRWIKLRVQAKRSSHGGWQYTELGRKPKGSPIRQYDTLIAESLRHAAIPLHVFYNGWPEDRFMFNDRYHDVIARHRRAARDGFHPSSAWDEVNWGCSIAAARVVKSIHEDPSISDFPACLLSSSQRRNLTYVPLYLIHSVPWALLLHGRGSSYAPTVREVAQNLHRMRGGDGELTDDDFTSMTYPTPSADAQMAAYGDIIDPIPREATREEQVRMNEGAHRALVYLQSLDGIGRDAIWSNLSPRNLDDLLPNTLGYSLLLDLDPQRGF